ncbi:hypothetical protein [Pontibacter liquoris]|uniref:hypothetical protein n=1 Tax=Pontibacter liquoris TaxID=2905677 RepID=UPI001FA7791F|nr:hypothetical protein [Pontibacter liquoris]
MALYILLPFVGALSLGSSNIVAEAGRLLPIEYFLKAHADVYTSKLSQKICSPERQREAGHFTLTHLKQSLP